MADSKKSPRPKGSRASGNTGGSGWSTSRPGGKGGGKPAGKGGQERRSGAGKSARKPGSSPQGGRARREDDPRISGGYGKPRAERKAPSPAPVDDFDIDLDVDLSGEAPAAFPSPARPAKSARDARPPRREGRAPGAQAKGPARPAADSSGPEALEEGKSVTAGRNPVRELLLSAPRRIDAVYVRKGLREARVQEIVALADENRVKVHFVDDVFLRRLHSGTHQGVVAVTAAVEYADLDALIAAVADAPLPVLLALDQVQDPGNMGAIARTAWALGAAGLIVPRHGGAYVGSGAMRASAGALHHLPVARVTNMSQALDACADAGLSILCADSDGEDLFAAEIRLPAVLVMGGEEKGVRHGVSGHCQQRLSIPFRREFDSLNVAQAAAICLARLGQVKG